MYLCDIASKIFHHEATAYPALDPKTLDSLTPNFKSTFRMERTGK